MLVVSLLYAVGPPAPDVGRRPAVDNTKGSPGTAVPLRTEASAGLPGSLQETDAAAWSEIPDGRAALHWVEYLQFTGAVHVPERRWRAREMRPGLARARQSGDDG